MAEGIIRAGIESLKAKYMPQIAPNTVYVPEESFRRIFSLLEVWGKETGEKETEDKAKYIYDKLQEQGSADELLVSLLTDLGTPQIGETRLDQVYKFIHLQENAQKAKQYYDTLNDRLNSMKKQEETNAGGK